MYTHLEINTSKQTQTHQVVWSKVTIEGQGENRLYYLELRFHVFKEITAVLDVLEDKTSIQEDISVTNSNNKECGKGIKMQMQTICPMKMAYCRGKILEPVGHNL